MNYALTFNKANLERAAIHLALVGLAAAVSAVGADLLRMHASDGTLVVGAITGATNFVVSFLRKEADQSAP